MLRCARSTASNPQLGADGHIPINGGRSGAIHTCLLKQRAGRSCDTPGTSPPVGAERTCMVDLWTSTLRSIVTDATAGTGCASRSTIAVLTLKVMHGFAPEYLGPVVRVAYLPGRQSLCSTGTNHLVVPQLKLSTNDTQAFPAASPRVWNSSAPSLSTFCQRLKTCLFRQSFHHLTI